MELVNGPLGRHTDGRNEKLALFLDHDVDKGGELATGVVLVGLAGVASDLGKEEIDAPREVGVLELGLDFLDLTLD